MLTDYKFCYIRDNGIYLEVKVRFYEGQVEDVLLDGKTVNRYVRKKALREGVFFVEKMDLSSLRKRFNAELKKDNTHTPILEQND